jgi:predicted DCC family thiol-disulfide oxidoreductase YuxK
MNCPICHIEIKSFFHSHDVGSYIVQYAISSNAAYKATYIYDKDTDPVNLLFIVNAIHTIKDEIVPLTDRQINTILLLK